MSVILGMTEVFTRAGGSTFLNKANVGAMVSETGDIHYVLEDSDVLEPEKENLRLSQQ